MIRQIRKDDRAAYLKMAAEFYTSDAVLNSVPQEHLEKTFDELMRSDNYVKGYIIECGKDTAGYALLVKSYSQEAGGLVVWVDELFVLPQYRNRGLAHEFFAFITNNVSENAKVFRLEVEQGNKRAISLYKQLGFEYLDYSQMTKKIG